MKAVLVAAALVALVAAPVASAGGGDPCADRDVSAGGVVGVEGNACNDGAAWACLPSTEGTALECVRYDWCTFCPGPVLF